MHNSSLLKPLVALVLIICAAAVQPTSYAQGPEQSLRERATALYNQNKFTEAIPLLEQLSKTNPQDVVVWEQLGWATLVVSASIKDADERTAARNRARQALLRAKELGDNSNLLRGGLEYLSMPDPADVSYSSNKDADAAMREGEEAHSRGDLDKAIEGYQRALQLDPKLYLAALWTGDMYFKKGYQETDSKRRERYLTDAGQWFARAIAIDENIETAHRYWGDALIAQGKTDEAKLHFIEAIVGDPTSRNAYMGLQQWGDRTGTKMAHPVIQVPVKITLTEDKKLNVVLDPQLTAGDEGAPWNNYATVRSYWFTSGFAKEFPGEQNYRHSLREEAEALRKTAEAASASLKSGKVKTLSPSLAALVKLNEADLLEPFILFARVDPGIFKDYADFRRTHRDKLRRYWTEVVIAPR